MTKLIAALKRLARDEQGTEATSIALGIVLIALVAGIGMVEFGDALADFFQALGTSFDDVQPSAIPTPENQTPTPGG